jgi:hypothetical protein
MANQMCAGKKGQKLVKPDVTAKLKIIIIIIKTKPMQTKGSYLAQLVLVENAAYMRS